MRRVIVVALALAGCGPDGATVPEVEPEPEDSSSTGAEDEPSDDGPGITSTSGHESSSGAPEDEESSSSDGDESTGGSSSGGEPVCLAEGTGYPCLDVVAYAQMCEGTHPDVRPQCFLVLALLFGGDEVTQALAMDAYACDGPCEAADACAAETGPIVCARWSDETVTDCAMPLFSPEAGSNAPVYVCEKLGNP